MYDSYEDTQITFNTAVILNISSLAIKSKAQTGLTRNHNRNNVIKK